MPANARRAYGWRMTDGSNGHFSEAADDFCPESAVPSPLERNLPPPTPAVPLLSHFDARRRAHAVSSHRGWFANRLPGTAKGPSQRRLSPCFTWLRGRATGFACSSSLPYIKYCDHEPALRFWSKKSRPALIQLSNALFAAGGRFAELWSSGSLNGFRAERHDLKLGIPCLPGRKNYERWKRLSFPPQLQRVDAHTKQMRGERWGHEVRNWLFQPRPLYGIQLASGDVPPGFDFMDFPQNRAHLTVVSVLKYLLLVEVVSTAFYHDARAQQPLSTHPRTTVAVTPSFCAASVGVINGAAFSCSLRKSPGFKFQTFFVGISSVLLVPESPCLVEKVSGIGGSN